MTKNLLLAVFAVLVLSAASFAQSYAGTWELDKAASKLEGRSKNIESMTATITQTEKEITVATDTKRAAPPEGSGMGGGRGMGGGMGGTDTATYSLDGKETKAERQGPMGTIPVVLKAKVSEGKIKLTRDSTINTPMGTMTMTISDTLSLSADGATLTIKREQTTSNGSSTNTFVLKKK